LPSVLLLDLKMPRMGGFEVLEWCKAQPHLNKMLIVVLSGHHELPEVNRAYALGAHSFLVKPSSREEIANLVKKFTGYWELGAPPLPRTPSSHNEI
jgi:CheY-like chemotaxis protein